MAVAAVGYLFGPGVWVAGNVLTNPIDTTVIVDSGPLLKGQYLFALTGTGSVNWVYDIQLRDATNTSNIDSQRRRPVSGNEDFFFPTKLTIDTDQRLRLILVGGIVGEIQMSLFLSEVG